MKKCKECKKYKEDNEFYGVQTECKECTKRRVKNNPNANSYDKTEKGIIRVIYKTQKSNSKRRKMSPPDYSKQELRDWLYKNDFKTLYDNWVASGYDKKMKPSVDRKDDFKPYTFDNIKLGTWKENKEHQTRDILNGTGTSGKRCKPVLCFYRNRLIAEYVSFSSARRVMGYTMERSLKSGRPDRNGFIWEYKKF